MKAKIKGAILIVKTGDLYLLSFAPGLFAASFGELRPCHTITRTTDLFQWHYMCYNGESQFPSTLRFVRGNDPRSRNHQVYLKKLPHNQQIMTNTTVRQ